MSVHVFKDSLLQNCRGLTERAKCQCGAFCQRKASQATHNHPWQTYNHYFCQSHNRLWQQVFRIVIKNKQTNEPKTPPPMYIYSPTLVTSWTDRQQKGYNFYPVYHYSHLGNQTMSTTFNKEFSMSVTLLTCVCSKLTTAPARTSIIIVVTLDDLVGAIKEHSSIIIISHSYNTKKHFRPE